MCAYCINENCACKCGVWLPCLLSRWADSLMMMPRHCLKMTVEDVLWVHKDAPALGDRELWGTTLECYAGKSWNKTLKQAFKSFKNIAIVKSNTVSLWPHSYICFNCLLLREPKNLHQCIEYSISFLLLVIWNHSVKNLFFTKLGILWHS